MASNPRTIVPKRRPALKHPSTTQPHPTRSLEPQSNLSNIFQDHIVVTIKSSDTAQKLSVVLEVYEHVLFSHRPSIAAYVRDIQAKLKKNVGKENFEIKIRGQGPEECVEDVEKANSEIKMEDGDESLAGADGRVCRGRNWIWEIEVMGKILFRVHPAACLHHHVATRACSRVYADAGGDVIQRRYISCGRRRTRAWPGFCTSGVGFSTSRRRRRTGRSVVVPSASNGGSLKALLPKKKNPSACPATATRYAAVE
nr:putative late blight resistance protein homolog R1A-10 [Ipomoea trifida]